MLLAIPVALLALALGAVSEPASSTPTIAQETYEDARFGFKLKAPKRWTQIPLSGTEPWLVAKFSSDKEHFATSKEEGWTFSHRPELHIVAFVKPEFLPDQEEEDDEGEGKKEESEEDKNRTVSLNIGNIYPDYKAYLEGTLRGAGYYIEDEQETEFDGIPVTCYDVKIEGWRAPGHITTWLFDTELALIAVQFEYLHERVKKTAGTLKKTFRSFEIIDRTESLGSLATGTVEVQFWDDLTPEEREDRRRSTQINHWEKLSNDLPDGWDAKEYGDMYVLSRVDDKFNKSLVERCLATMDWLDETFDYIGEEEYARRPILRVCKDRDELQAYMSGTTGFTFGNGPAVFTTFKDTSAGSDSFSLNQLNRYLVGLWLSEKDRPLYYAMPSWLDYGLRYLVQNATIKGKALKPTPNEWEKLFLRRTSRDPGLQPCRQLMSLGARDMNSLGIGGWAQAAALVRHVLVGKGSKSGKTKGLIERYIRNLDEVLTELEEADEKKRKERGEKERPKPKTEEEEEEMNRARTEAFRERERFIIDEVTNRTFADWTSKDWDDLEKAFLKSI